MWRYNGIVSGVLVRFLANEILIDDQERSSLDNKSKEKYLSAESNIYVFVFIFFYTTYSFLC